MPAIVFALGWFWLSGTVGSAQPSYNVAAKPPGSTKVERVQTYSGETSGRPAALCKSALQAIQPITWPYHRRTPSLSVHRERCSFQNGRPARNFRLHQASKTRGRSFLLGGDRSAQLGQSVSD